MESADSFIRQERQIRLVLRGALGLLVLAIILAVVVRFRSDAPPAPKLNAQTTADKLPDDGGADGALFDTGLMGALDSTAALTTLGSGGMPPLAASAAAEDDLGGMADDPSQGGAQGNASQSRRRAPIATDVILLPCSLRNPRADGGFIIPPHNPRNRTVVGLPSKPGEPKRGFFIPPHDPSDENRIPVDVIAMDTFLAKSIRVPPHDPTARNVVYLDTVPCLQGQ